MRVLFVTNDYTGEKRAGPAIRALELAKVLSRNHQVTVASAKPGRVALDGIELISDCAANPALLRAAAASSDVAITQGLVLSTFPFLKRAKHLVIELYDPYLFEYLAHSHARFPGWGYLRQWYLVNEQVNRGDFFVCANDRQRDYWLGRLCALGRLTPKEYERDPTFRHLLDVVPFGIPSDPPKHSRAVVKGVIPGIAREDVLLLWSGGIWQWFDPLTLIRAMAEVSNECSNVKLLFLGAGHPDPLEPEMPIVEQARQLTQELGLLNRAVFFHDGWIPSAEMQDCLLEADIAVAIYFDSIETRFAFRTRVRDYIWAGLPMILTRGDSFADLVDRQQLGRTVDAGDVIGLKTAILDLAAKPQERQFIRQRLSQIAPQFYWDKVAEPLLRYCDHPYSSSRHPQWQQRVVPLLSRSYQFGYRKLARYYTRSGRSAMQKDGGLTGRE